MKWIYFFCVIFSFLLFDVHSQGLGHARQPNRHFTGRGKNLATDKTQGKLSSGGVGQQKATAHVEVSAGTAQSHAGPGQSHAAQPPPPANQGRKNNGMAGSRGGAAGGGGGGGGGNGMFGMGPFGLIEGGFGDMFYPNMFRPGVNPNSNTNNNANNMGMNAWMRSQISGIDIHPSMRKFICRGIKAPAKGTPVNPSLIYQHGLKAMMMAQSPMISKDINIGEGAAFCHGKEMEYRSCDKTPSRFRMPCQPNAPNSCNNPQMICSVYNPDGYPQCCAKNFMLANQLDRMWR